MLLAVVMLALGACAHRPSSGIDLSTRSHNVPNAMPLDPPRAVLTSVFGEPRKATSGGGGATRRHAGIDLAAPKGTPVVAAAGGRVYEADRSGSYGKIVKIDHCNGMETWYAHLDSFSVRAGDGVARGRRIGTVGATGNATGNHLHYEVHVDGKPVDPIPYLPRGVLRRP